MSQPGFYFYTGDWLKDTRTLSLEARGAWIDLLCALNEAGGSVTWPLRAFDQYLGTISHNGIEYSASEILEELSTLGICTVVTEPNGGVTVTSRRITRECNYKESNRKRQQRYRENSARNASVTALGNGSSSSESSSYSSSYPKKSKKKNNKRASVAVATDDLNAYSEAEWPSPEKLVQLYNELTPDDCAAVQTLSPARRAKAEQYLKIFPKQEFWEQVFDRVHHSQFLRGCGNRSNGHGNFHFDFDWMLTKGKDGSENVVKVAEGRYADERK